MRLFAAAHEFSFSRYRYRIAVRDPTRRFWEAPPHDIPRLRGCRSVPTSKHGIRQLGERRREWEIIFILRKNGVRHTTKHADLTLYPQPPPLRLICGAAGA